MAEETKPTPSAPMGSEDLKILVNGTPKKINIRDSKGVDHPLNPLNMTDIVEFEGELGISILEIPRADLKLKHILFMLYLSLRKEGCNQDDLERRKYKYTLKQVGDMFDLAFLKNAVTVLSDLLSVSGFDIVNPPMPSSPRDTMPVAEPGKA